MKALVLEKMNQLALREIDVPEKLGPQDVRIAIHTVGVCGSDVHYYTHGRIGDYVVRGPMVLGHEAAGVVIEIGAEVTSLRVGDRVCMEPGVPNLSSRASKLGIYNVDPDVTFWATLPSMACCDRRSSIPQPSPIGCPIRSPSPKAPWSSLLPSACRRHRGPASFQATSPR